MIVQTLNGTYLAVNNEWCRSMGGSITEFSRSYYSMTTHNKNTQIVLELHDITQTTIVRYNEISKSVY